VTPAETGALIAKYTGEYLRRTAQTGEASTVHKPLGKPGGPGLWHHKTWQLPAYIQSVAQHLRAAHGESRAIEMAVGIVKNWAAGHDGHGNRVHPDVQVAASKAVAEWEALKTKASKARRSQVAGTPEYDADGLDASWDGDHSDLPDLSGLQVHHFEAAEKQMGMGGGAQASRASAAPLGSGGRFKKLSASLAAKGAHDPGALAAWIGRKKYGRTAFKKLSAAARKAKGGGSRMDPWRPEYMRFYPLEDMHILRSADGGDGRTVEAFAAVFETPAEIQDFEGHYQEVIDRAAFSRVLDHIERQRGGLTNVKVLYNHGMTIQGTPSERFSVPIGVPVAIRAEARGLLTRTRYSETPLADEILESVRAGTISAQSFTGRIVRSDPSLRRGDTYRPRNGELPTVRRMELGLREYGPVLWPAYSGAEILGVRMSTPGEYAPDPDELDEALPPDEGPATGDPPAPAEGDEHSARYHQHALYALRSKELREKAGLVW
jgi:HK97 family phage prohead protease